MRHALASGPGLVASPETGLDADHGWKVTATAAALATLGVILGSSLLSGPRPMFPPVPEEPRIQLTRLAERSLAELPAYRIGDNVVVVAALDRNLERAGWVPHHRIEADAVALGGSALLDYADQPLAPGTAGWVRDISSADRVYAQFGPLYVACVEAAPGQDCTPAVLVYDDISYQYFLPELEPHRVADGEMAVHTLRSVNGTDIVRLLIGRIGRTDVGQVLVTVKGGWEITATTTTGLAVPGETLWVSRVPGTALAVTVYGKEGEVLARHPLDD
jgi:hypothetical protein